MLKNLKKQMQKKLKRMKQKKNSFFEEMKFFIKGMDVGEDIMRVVKITGIMGLTLLVIMLTGKTIQYIAKERPAVSEETQVKKETKETEKLHANSRLDTLNNHINEMQQTIGTMHENFQNGCNIISAAITAKGVDTPVNSTPNTMADNIAKLAEARYKQGYVDGAASVGAAGVEYEYHYHNGNEQEGGACFTEAEYHIHDPQSCYGICSNRNLKYVEDYYDGNHDHKYVYQCPTCGFLYSSYGSEGDGYSRTHVSSVPTCGKSENQILGYKCTCGMSDGQIISAKITY